MTEQDDSERPWWLGFAIVAFLVGLAIGWVGELLRE